MNFWGEVIRVLDAKMQVPEMYGWFHLLFFALSIVAGVWLCRCRNAGDERFTRRLLVVSAVIVFVLEIYKQINFTFSYDGTTITADYQWYIFPFQLCSTPMYISLIAGIVRHKKVHDALCAYLATFALFAGLCVMFYPPQVYVSTIGINIQSMICHGAMIAVGIYLFGTKYVKAQHKTIVKAIPVFAVCVVVAMILNEIAYFSGLLENETFNMFFISPHCEPSLPVYSLVQAVVPFPWCLFIYIIAFSAAAYIILLITMLIGKLATKRKPKTVVAKEDKTFAEISK